MLNNFSDPLILFVCLDYPECLELIDAFEGASDERLRAELENFAINVLESKVEVNLENGEIILPKVLQVYAADFEGGERQILQFILRYTEQQLDIASIVERVKEKTIVLKYHA